MSFDSRWEKKNGNQKMKAWVGECSVHSVQDRNCSLSLQREQGQQHQANGDAYITKCDWKPEDKKQWTQSDHVRLDRIAQRLVMGNKGRCKYPGCDGIVGSRAAITSLHHIKRNCFLEFSKTQVGLITWSHSYKRIVTCTQSIISVGNMKRKGEGEIMFHTIICKCIADNKIQ